MKKLALAATLAAALPCARRRVGPHTLLTLTRSARLPHAPPGMIGACAH